MAFQVDEVHQEVYRVFLKFFHHEFRRQVTIQPKFTSKSYLFLFVIEPKENIKVNYVLSARTVGVCAIRP
jgi:hypothetical protein